MAGFDINKANQALVQLGKAPVAPQAPAQGSMLQFGGYGAAPAADLPLEQQIAVPQEQPLLTQEIGAMSLAPQKTDLELQAEQAMALQDAGGSGSLSTVPSAVVKAPSVNPYEQRGPATAGAPRGPGMPSSPFSGMAKEAGARAATEQEAAKQAEIQYDIGSATQAQGIEDQASAQQASAVDQEALFKRAAAKDQDYAARAQLTQTAVEQATAKRLAEKEAEAKQMETYEVKDKRSAGTKAMAAIAIGLGELGAGISRAFGVGGQQNTALQIINSDVEKRLQEQQIKLDNVKTAAQMRDSAYGIAMAAYKDKRDVDSYARELENGATIKELEAAKAKLTGTEALAQADSLIGQLAQQNAALSMQRHDRRFEISSAEQQAYSIKDYEAKARAAAAAAKAAAAEQETGFAFLGTNVGVENPDAFKAWSQQTKETEKEKMRKAIQGHAQYTDALQKMKKLKETYGSEGRLTPWTTDAEATYKAYHEQAINGANEMKDGNMLGDKEYERYSSMIPPAGDFASTAMPKLEGLLSAADDKINATLRTIGARSVRAETLTRRGAAGGAAPSASAPSAPAAPKTRTPAAPGQVVLSDAEEAKFQEDMRNGEGYKQWREQFEKKNGAPPTIDDPDYDYRAAWKNGVRPAPYGHDGGAYHWASSAGGKMLKSENHPTAWMEHFMQATGKDPNDLGLKDKAAGDRYLAALKGQQHLKSRKK